jgi:hypothetical protein
MLLFLARNNTELPGRNFAYLPNQEQNPKDLEAKELSILISLP